MALVWPTGLGLIIIVTCVADVTTFHNVASSATPKYLALLHEFDQRVIGVTELSGVAIAFARRDAPPQIGRARRGKRSHEPRPEKAESKMINTIRAASATDERYAIATVV